MSDISHETTEDFLRHLTSFLEATHMYHRAFTDNPAYLPYLERSQREARMSPLAFQIIENQKKLGNLAKTFCQPSFTQPGRLGLRRTL